MKLSTHNSALVGFKNDACEPPSSMIPRGFREEKKTFGPSVSPIPQQQSAQNNTDSVPQTLHRLSFHLSINVVWFHVMQQRDKKKCVIERNQQTNSSRYEEITGKNCILQYRNCTSNFRNDRRVETILITPQPLPLTLTSLGRRFLCPLPRIRRGLA